MNGSTLIKKTNCRKGTDKLECGRFNVLESDDLVILQNQTELFNIIVWNTEEIKAVEKKQLTWWIRRVVVVDRAISQKMHGDAAIVRPAADFWLRHSILDVGKVSFYYKGTT